MSLRSGYCMEASTPVSEGMGMAISLGGIVLLTRAIGPEQYGIFAAAFGFYCQNVQLGIAVIYASRRGGRLLNYTIRHPSAFARTGSNAFSSSGFPNRRGG